MKTVNKIIICLVFSIIITGFFSCDKYLENENMGITYSEVFWKNETDARSACAGAYSLLRTAMLNEDPYFTWGDLPAEFFVADGGNAWMSSDALKGGFHYMPYLEQAMWDWTKWYRAVQQCNLIIDQVPQISMKTDVRDQLTGEGYFVRALSYFYMTRVWGDLPYEVTPIYTSKDIVMRGRTSSDSIMDLICSDAQKASALMSWGNSPVNRCVATKGAALALLAHAYAWKGDYQKTLLYADSLINNSGGIYELEPGNKMRNVFMPETGSKELIFFLTRSLAKKEESSIGGGYQGSIANKTLADPYIKNYMANPIYHPSADKMSIYFPYPEDQRLKQFFGKTSSTSVPILIKYSDVDYKSPNYGTPFFQSNHVVFRLADIILLKAEALATLNRPSESRDAMNMVRRRAEIKDVDVALTGNQLLKEIVNERIRELSGEGHNYYDQLRTKNYPGWYNGTRTESRYKSWLWPIHDDILKNNHLINQNEWWKSH